jgi:hypothetical protein
MMHTVLALVDRSAAPTIATQTRRLPGVDGGFITDEAVMS